MNNKKSRDPNLYVDVIVTYYLHKSEMSGFHLPIKVISLQVRLDITIVIIQSEAMTSKKKTFCS